jgi:chromosome segregation protein
MSYIKRLKLKGFKSFANSTILTFEEGFNTVVGANGSGKSNVFDAMCFVLGRMSSKELRTEKLGNLVFNGGKNLKPAKQAEVSIYLSNNEKELLNIDLDEVKVTRIVTKEGKSKYLLNNQKSTRTEIVEVLHRADINPDGYNIILQGDITRIVNMTTRERRELIEEISNVSGYEEKKSKAVKKLDILDTDLKEADLLMEEKTKYLRELKSEKEQAEKYNKAKEDLRYSGLLLSKSKIIKNLKLKQTKESDLIEQEEKLSIYKTKLDDFDNTEKEIDNKIINLEKEIEIKSHGDFIKVSNKIIELETEKTNLSEKKAENKKDLEELKTKIIGIKVNISENKKDMSLLEDQINDFTSKKTKVQSSLVGLETQVKSVKNGMSSESFEKIDEIEEQIEELITKKYDKELIKNDNATQVEVLNSKIEHLESEQSRLDGLSGENKDQAKELDTLRKELKSLIATVSTKANLSSELAAKIHSLQKEYSITQDEHNKVRIKLDSSQQAIAQNRAVDTITKLKSSDSAIHGTVAELASVPDKYSMALETAAGRSLFNVVVDDDRVAVKYINFLREKRVGSATFLPLNKVNAKYRLDDSVLNKPGVVDYALNLINYDSRYENIFHLIFGDLLVIENIEYAKNIGIGKYKMITLDGDLVAKSGAMSGGFKARKQSIGLFKDDKLTDKAAAIDDKLSRLSSTLSHLREEKEDVENSLSDVRHRKNDIDGEVVKLEKLLSIEGRDSSDVKSEIEAIVGDKMVIEGSLKKLGRDIETLQERINELNIQKKTLKGESSGTSGVLDNLNKLEEQRDEVRNQLLELNSQIDNRSIKLNSVLKPELNNLNKILGDSQNSESVLKQKIDEMTQTIRELIEDLKNNRALEKELSKGYKDLISQRDELREDKKKLEIKYEKEFVIYDKIKDKVAQIRYMISEFETLNKTLSDDLEVLFNQTKAELVQSTDDIEDKVGIKRLEELLERIEERLSGSPIDVKELQSKVNNLKSRVASFGSINMKAVELYDKINEEFTKLLEKREILNSEKDEILDFIAEMDGKKKEKFMETFNILKGHFVNLFDELSTKGKVELIIEDEENLWDSGVEIRVRLSEKNYLDIKSLSGGEKTITAVAFIFAVQEFNPASFYVFDEIDAALDIMNCEKLGKLIRKNAHKAQYVVVSHSEHFIQSAQTIYGVTMDKNKISGVLSLDLTDMTKYVDKDAAPVEK